MKNTFDELPPQIINTQSKFFKTLVINSVSYIIYRDKQITFGSHQSTFVVCHSMFYLLVTITHEVVYVYVSDNHKQNLFKITFDRETKVKQLVVNGYVNKTLINFVVRKFYARLNHTLHSIFTDAIL